MNCTVFLFRPFRKFDTGMTVRKKSGKPFKSGEKIETIVSFGYNETDPKKRRCAIFTDGSVCNLDLLVSTNVINPFVK